MQYPWKPGEVAVVFRGLKGTGKSFFAKHVGELFGDHFVEMTSARHLTGNFNAHLETAVFVFADEAFWAGDKQGESTLKALITSETMLLERKGIDSRMAPNYTHLVVASNSDWTVPASLDERRFFALDIAPGRRNDHEYFRRLEEAWKSGEREAFLHHLQALDISDFNVRNVPQTEALLDQKLMSLGVVERWFFDALNNGRFELESWKDWLPTRALHESLVAWCKLMSVRVPTTEAMGMRLTALVPLPLGSKSARVQRTDGGHRAWGYELGPIEACRQHFERLIGAKVEWVTEGNVKASPTLDSGKY